MWSRAGVHLLEALGTAPKCDEPPAGSGAWFPSAALTEQTQDTEVQDGAPRGRAGETAAGARSLPGLLRKWAAAAAPVAPGPFRARLPGTAGEAVTGSQGPGLPQVRITLGVLSVCREDSSSVPAETPSCSVPEDSVLSVSVSTWPTAQGDGGPISVYTGLGPRPQPGGCPQRRRPGKPPGRGTPVVV